MVVDLKRWVFTALLRFHNVYGENYQKKVIIDKFLGKYCKIITKETNEKKTHALTGIISDFDQDENTIVVESTKGVFYLKVDTIFLIKPRKRLKRNN